MSSNDSKCSTSPSDENDESYIPSDDGGYYVHW